MKRPDIPKEATHVEYFEKLALQRINNSPMARIEGLNFKVQFEITGEDEGKWTLVLEDGRAKGVIEGNGIIPDCTLSMSGDVFMGIVRQEINPQQAFFEEKIKVSGDTMLGLRMAVLASYL
ncbi:MAG: SCP2 sterol-binding domain-containing protein [Candidatus Brocadiales bacterium]